MNWFLDVLKNKYALFEGRARREEFWMFTLISIIISIVVGFVARAIGLNFLAAVYSLAILVPSIAVAARRLHDINKSGWWQLVGIIPIIGWIIVIIWYATDSDEGSNQYGENPKGL
ncbi:MAG: DUF805 domain-containing protein [Aquirhabdus sp.]